MLLGKYLSIILIKKKIKLQLQYYAKGVTLQKSVSSSSSSSAECWSEKYPLHRAAHDNNVDDIRPDT